MARRRLLAEDDPDNRGIVVKVLTREGYQTLEAADGHSALALGPPGASRPDRDGPRHARDGRFGSLAPAQGGCANGRYPGHQRSPHFALRGDEERVREAGCDGYLSKPCRPQTIREVVARFLAGR